MGGLRLHGEPGPEVLGDPLVTKADPEERQLPRQGLRDHVAHAPLPGGPRAGRQENQVGPQLLEQSLREARPNGGHFRAGHSQVGGEGMDETVQEIHQQDAPSRAATVNPRARRRAGLGLLLVQGGLQECRGLDSRLPLLGFRVRIEQQRRPGAHGGLPSLEVDGAQGHAGIEIAVHR